MSRTIQYIQTKRSEWPERAGSETTLARNTIAHSEAVEQRMVHVDIEPLPGPRDVGLAAN